MLYNNKTCGLLNLGNTCYLNSVVQCLAYSPSLLLFMEDSEFDLDIVENTKTTNMVKELRSLLIKLWLNNTDINPIHFKKQVDHSMLVKNWSGIMMGHQNDAHEFLEFILECLHEALQYTPNISISKKVENEKLTSVDKLALEAYGRWKDHFKNGYSFIIDNFYGQFISEIKKGENISYCFDPFSVLTLEIPDVNQDSFTLDECLDNFMKVEQLGQNIQKKFYFWKIPKNLVIVIKRFTNNGLKCNKRINYSDTIDLSKYSKSYERTNIIYKLSSICCHKGDTNFGHYFTLARKKLKGDWFKIDDNNIISLENNGALPITNAAYILFYHKC